MDLFLKEVLCKFSIQAQLRKVFAVALKISGVSCISSGARKESFSLISVPALTAVSYRFLESVSAMFSSNLHLAYRNTVSNVRFHFLIKHSWSFSNSARSLRRSLSSPPDFPRLFSRSQAQLSFLCITKKILKLPSHCLFPLSSFLQSAHVMNLCPFGR